MRDPFGPPPSSLISLLQPVASRLKLSSLPLHAHEIVLSFLLYEALFFYVSPALSASYSSAYKTLPRRSKINWHVKVVSFIQSVLICTLALSVIIFDDSRLSSTAATRLWAYTPASGLVEAFAAGYFCWDVHISVQYFRVLGPGSLAHGISALLITMIGFRPFANFYGMNFILYELSTPCLNIHWFLDKVGMTGGIFQLVNGICLISTFFLCRLVWGTYQSYRLLGDVWAAWTAAKAYQAYSESGANGNVDQVVPMWLLGMYLVSNTLLSGLNIYWFGKMVQALQKRFETPKNEKKMN